MFESSKEFQQLEYKGNAKKYTSDKYNKRTEEKIKKQESSVIIYDTKEYTYHLLKSYEYKEILSIILNYHHKNSLLIQINNDDLLQEYILKTITKKLIKKDKTKSNKEFDLNLDYLLDIDHNLLCLNMSVLADAEFQDIEKYVIQIYCFDKGIILLNKSGNQEIFNSIVLDNHFKEKKHNFTLDKISHSAESLKKLGKKFFT